LFDGGAPGGWGGFPFLPKGDQGGEETKARTGQPKRGINFLALKTIFRGENPEKKILNPAGGDLCFSPPPTNRCFVTTPPGAFSRGPGW